MYSERVTADQLAAAQAVIDRRPRKTDRYQLERIPLHRIDPVVAHFNNLLDDAGNLDATKRPKGLTQREREIVEGQRIVCKLDYNYFVTHYWWIKSYLGLMRLQPNIAQQIDISIWAEHEEKFWPILIFELKARQLGKSELYQSAIGHRVCFYHHTQALVASSDPEKSRLLADEKVGRGISALPWWLRPASIPSEPYKSGEVFWEFPDLDSVIILQHGTQRSGLARGTTTAIFHLTEFSEFNNAAELVDASLLYSVHEDPMTFGCIEGTAKGDSGWGRKRWEAAKQLWPQGMSRLRPNFTPWFTGTDLYPTPGWLHMHPIPTTWKPDELTEGHARKSNEYVAQHETLQRVLGSGWTMNREQQWYWHASRREAEELDELEGFMGELAANDIDCWQASGYSIFSPQTLLRVSNTAKSLALYEGKPAVFAIVGHEIPQMYEPVPSQIDRDRKPIKLVSTLALSMRSLIFHLYPLHFEGFTAHHELNRLYVWEMPTKVNDYGIGSDLGEGIGRDRSVAEVLRKGTIAVPSMQVAEFAANNMNTIEFAPILFAVGLFYSVRSGPAAFTQPLMAIEGQAGGYATQEQLRKWGWSNFPDWRGARDQRKPHAGNRIGWVTTGWNRDEIIARPAKYIKSGDLIVNSPYLISEMQTLKRADGARRIEASQGHFDDRWFAFGIDFINLHMDTDLYRGEHSTWEQSEEQASLAAEQATASLQPDLTSWRILPVPSGTGTTGAFDDPERFW